VVEQILSAGDDDPDRLFVQAQDEWVAVLAGAAELEVNGQILTLAAGDWVFLPATVAHRVRHADAGTSWLAVHLYPA